MSTAEQLTPSVAYHGEGAIWWDAWGGLRFVDMLAGDVLTVDSSSGAVERLHVDPHVAAMVRPRVGGGFLVATERRFALWADGREEWSTAPLWAEGMARFNEGGCTPWGDVLCGTIHHDRATGSAEVWALHADRSTERVFGDVTISNGLGFTADGSRMYYIDSRTRRIDVFDADEGRLERRRPFVHVSAGVGNPDGLCVDVEGGVWVALYGGSAVHRYDAAGRLTEVVELPVTKPTSCTLGGASGTELFITTSREDLPDDVQPAAGAIFHAEAGVSGVPVIPCPM